MIGIDTTFFGHEEIRNGKLSLSTSIFTADLLDAFAEIGRSQDFCLIVNYNHEDFFKRRFPQYKICTLKNPLVSLAKKITGKPLTKYLKKLGTYKRTVQKMNLDFIWFPFAIPQTFVKTGTPSAATIHDVYRIHTDGMKSGFEEIFRNCFQIFSVSDYTKNDILKSTGFESMCKPEIRTIPNSIKFELGEKKEIGSLKDTKFILDINAYNEKKNALTLLKAFDLIKDKISATLVLCGGYKDDEYFKKLESFVCENSLETRVRILVRIPEAEKNWLFGNASLFVTPSTFEGFGRTPVEAAICRIPVISTKDTSLFEATRGLVHYVDDSKNPQELADRIIEVLENPDSEEKLDEISKALLREYNPLNCARKYLQVFDEKLKK